MSKNKEKKPVVENKKNEKTEAKVKLEANKLAIIIACCAVGFLLLVVGIVLLVDYVKNDRGFDYMDSDLSGYVNIDTEDYKDFDLSVDVARPREVDMLTAILALQAKNKGDRLCGENQWLTGGKNLVVTPGSLVKLRYRGYKLSEAGEIIEVPGLTNFGSLEADIVEVGGLNFPTGFEVNLLGASLATDRAMFSKRTDGKITLNDVVYISYTKTYTSTSAVSTVNTERVDMASDVDSVYGQGFMAELVKMNIGDTKEFTLTDAKGNHCKYKLKVDFATTCEKQENILKIDAYFPYSYSVETLRNADVVFEVYIESIQPFEYDEFDDEFVGELLKKEDSAITEDELKEYEGEGLAAKYRSYLEKNLEESYRERYDEIVEKALWEHLRKVATIKKYPASKVDHICEEYFPDIQNSFDSNEGKIYNNNTFQYDTYKTVDEYGAAYLGIKNTADYTWRDYIRESAQMVVAERMILFYIMDKENITPSDADFNEEYESIRQEYLDAYVKQRLEYDGKTEEDFTEEEYDRYVSACASEIFDYYDEDYFKETAYYNLVLETLISWANVITLDDVSNAPQDK